MDLNLLAYLDLLLDEQSVTRAAARAGVTQSAMSRALGKLRDLFDDPLLVRTGQGMTCTARAESLAPRIREMINQISTCILAPPRFEASSARAVWRVASTEMSDSVLMGSVVSRLRREAPGIDLRLVGPGPAYSGGLGDGRVDMVIGVASSTRSTVHSYPLLSDDYACLMRRRHPLRRKGLAMTLERYLGCSHVLVSPGQRPGGVVDDHLASRELRRHVAVTVSSFLLAPMLVVDSDLLLTLPRVLARTMARMHRLHMCEVPLELEPVTLSLLWHARWHHDPCHAWLRSVIVDAAAALDTGAAR